MENKPLVSILMTAYNREKYLAAAIESTIASTFKDWELIIVDDASADATLEIADKYAAQDCRIKVYSNAYNLGDYPNRNKAASYAKGKYVKYIDSDDYIYPCGLEIMVNSMQRYPGAGFGLCSLKPNKDKPFPFMLSPKEAYEYHFFGPGLFHQGPLTAIFLKSAFDKTGGFKNSRMISDTDMWHRMALQCPVVLMPEGIVWQRRHAKQELTIQQQFITGREKIKWEYLLHKQCPLNKQEVKRIRKMRIKKYTRFILSGIKKINLQQVSTYSKCLLFVLKIKV